MGLSSKTTKTTNTETVAPSAYSQPYIDAAAATLKPSYDQSQSVVSKFLPQLDNVASYYGDVMGGKFLNGNPYLDSVVNASNADITDSVNATFMPRFGSGYHAKALAKQLGDNEAKLRYGDYATERGYMNNAAAAMPGVAATATALPMIPAQAYADSVNSLLGRYMTANSNGTQKQSGGLLGSLLSVGSAVLSDERLKENIRRVGQTDGGVPLYSYNYRNDPTPHIGPMAQEVAQLQPEALGPEVGGFLTVRYGELV